MENFIVFFIVAAAGLWGVSRFVRKRKAAACSTGCAGCSCPSKVSQSPLVTLRR
jgi:hypothetical protein